MRFFKINQNTAEPIAAQTRSLEKELQTLFENNLQTLLGVRFLGRQFPPTKGKYIDTIGIDGQNRPVIIEYKKATDKFQIFQITDYAFWLKKNKDKFALVVADKINPATANQINWEKMRLICIAWEFNKSDALAAEEQNDQIELIRYGILDDDILLLEQIAGDSGLDKLPLSSVTTGIRQVQANEVPSRQEHISSTYNTNTFRGQLERAGTEVKARFNNLRQYALSLGNDTGEKETKRYLAFTRGRDNFVITIIRPKSKKILLYLAGLNPDDTPGRDMSGWNIVLNDDDMEKAKPLLERSYQNSG